MFQAASRSFTSSSESVNSALAEGPTFSARAASATALRYCGTPNLAVSPRPMTSTRGAVMPGRSCSRVVLPVLPPTSPRWTSALSLPPLAASSARPAGLRVLSPKAPTTMQSKPAVAGASWFSVNSSDIEQIPESVSDVFVQFRTIAGLRAAARPAPGRDPTTNRGPDPSERTRDCKPTPYGEAGPLPLPRIHPELPGHVDRAAGGEPGRGHGRPAGQYRRWQAAGGPAFVADGAAIAQLPAADPAVGADAGPVAVLCAAVPGFGNAGADLDRGRPEAPAAGRS